MARTAIRGVGAMRESLTLQTNVPPVLVVSSLTRTGTTAMTLTAGAHEYLTGEYVLLAGANEPGWNLRPKILVVSPTVFSFTVADTLPTPATGTITVTYAGDPQRGRRDFWRTIARVRAAMDPIQTYERLERGTIRSSVDYRFRIHRRDDVTASMRALWTPSTGGPEQTLILVGKPILVGDGRRFMDLEMTTAAVTA